MRMDTISVPTKYEQSVAFRYTSSSTKMPNPDKNRATQRNAGIPTITRSVRFILTTDWFAYQMVQSRPIFHSVGLKYLVAVCRF